MAQEAKIIVNVVDSDAKLKLKDLGIKVDQLSQKKLTIKADVDENTIRSVSQLTDKMGTLVSVTKDYDKKTGELKNTVVSATKDFQAEQKAIEKAEKAKKSAAKETEKLKKETEKLEKQQSKTSKATELLHKTLLRLSHVAIMAVVRSFRDAVNEMKAVDRELTVISRVTQTSIDDLDSLKDRAYDIGKAYGVLASDYLSAAAAFTRAGYREQAADLAELSSKLQMAAGVSAETANQLLITMDVAYGLKGSYKDLSKVMDELIVIDHKYATSVQKVADGMGIIAPIAAQTHVSAEELMAAVGTITATTQRTGSEAARAFRAIALNIIGDTKTEIEDGTTWTAGQIEGLRDVLKLYAKDVVEAAEATGEVINPMKAVGALAQSYKDGILTEAKLMQMVSDIGGKLRASQLLALIQNWDMYNSMLADTQEAVGAVDKDIEKALDSWEVKANQLKATFTELTQSLLETKSIKGFVDSARLLMESLADPDAASEAFEKAFTTALHNLVQRLPQLQNVIGKLSAQLVTALIKGLAKEQPNIFRYLISGAREATEHLVHNLPEILSGIGKLIGETLSEAILRTDFALLGAEIVGEILVGVLLGLGNLAVGLVDGFKAAFQNMDVSDATHQIREEIASLKEEIESVGTETDKMRKSLVDADKEARLAEYWLEIFEKYSSKINLTEDEQRKLNIAVSKLNEILPNTKIQLDEETRQWNTTTQAIKDNIIALQKRARAEVYYEKIKADMERVVELEAEVADRRIAIEELTAKKQTEYSEERLQKLNDSYSKFTASFAAAINNHAAISVKELDAVALSVAEEFGLIGQIGDEAVVQADLLQPILYSVLSDFDGGLKRINSEIATQESYIETAEDGIATYNAEISKYTDLAADATGETSELNEELKKTEKTTDDGADSFDNVSASIQESTKALSTFQEKLKDGEKGDVFKSYADAFEKAKEKYEQGLVGSNTYMAAIDLLFGDAITSYEEAGKLLGNSFVKAMFEGAGDDYGANAANYIREHLDEFRGVAIEEAGDGTFSLLVEDMDAFSASTGLSKDALWALMDALDAFDSKPLEEADKQLEEVDKQLEDLTSDKHGIVVEVESNADSEFGKIEKYVKALNNSKINIGVAIGTMGSGVISNAKGTDSSNGGLALVNDGTGSDSGPELIVSKGRAYIAGGGEPVITHLDRGDVVYTAKETKDIFKRSGINSFAQGKGSTAFADGTGLSRAWGGSVVKAGNISVSSIPKTTSKSSGGGSSSKAKEETEDILKLLDEYIDDLLKKAKKALDAQIDEIDAQIKALKDSKKAAEEQNELEELRLKILEAEKKLIDANVERTVRYFNEQTGQWEWMADQKAVADAQKSLEDAQTAYFEKLAELEYEAQLNALEEQKDALKEGYDRLEDSWDEIKDTIEKALSEKDVLSFAEILSKLGLTNAKGSSGDVTTLVDAINAFSAGSFDNGGVAYGRGFLRKATSRGEVVLDPELTDKVLSPRTNAQFASFSDSLSKLLGMSTGDTGAKAQSLITSLDRSSSVVGDTYYINGVKIGSDMLNKPLSEVLSVLPIYAHNG